MELVLNIWATVIFQAEKKIEIYFTWILYFIVCIINDVHPTKCTNAGYL